MQSSAEQIKERLAIQDVIASYVRLEKAGIYFKARCPFHNEKTPSFFVSPSRGSYHCFGCGRGGDIFSFVQEIEGIDFMAALKILAERAGIKLTEKYSKEDSERALMYRAMEDATKFYEELLRKNKSALEYLKGRGLTEKTIEEFRLGFAPSPWSLLYAAMKEKGHSDATLIAAGLIIKGKREYFDRFRDRIMFPIMDSRGKVVAFTGRIFSDAPASDAAKYVNSPETPLYSKSNILYGYHLAKQSMMKDNRVVIVEGQMDLIMAHQAGTENSVAVSGTALTKEHLGLIKRFTTNTVFCFDADNAGMEAGERSIKLALGAGMEVSLISLPQGSDPADYIKERGNDAWNELAKVGKPIIDFYLDALFEKPMDDRERMRAISKQVLPYVALLNSRLLQGHYITKISNRSGIAEKYIDEELSKINVPAAYLEDETTAPIIPIKTNEQRLRDELLGYFLLGYAKSDSRIPVSVYESEWERITGNPILKEIESFELNSKEDMILQAEVLSSGKESLEKESEELFSQFERFFLEKRFQEILGELKKAERDKDSVRSLELLGECQKISNKIHEIKSRQL